MMFQSVLLCGTVGFLVAFFLIPVIRRVALSRAASDQTRQFHQTHKNPVPRFGGLALAVAFLAVIGLITAFFPGNPEIFGIRLAVAVTALAMFALGFWDDCVGLGARRKLAGQVLIAFVAWQAGIRIETFQNPLTGDIYQLGWVGAVVTVFWLVAMTNLVNLIDGIDGLAGGISLMLMGLLVYVGYHNSGFPLMAAGMVGALVGFLYYNFPPARIYMGDGGAYFLGFLIGSLTIVGSQKGTVIAALIGPLFVLALPIIDVSLAILRRGFKGLPLFRPDRKHIHHRLVQFGFSHTKTVLILYGVSVLFLALGFCAVWSRGQWVPILLGLLCLVVILAGRSFAFSREWFAVGRVLGNSLELRKESQYALTLGRWLEMEAERANSADDLWADFEFVARKLGFCRVTLAVDRGEITWEAPADPAAPADLRCTRHEMVAGRVMTLDFAAHDYRMDPRLFEHLSDLAGEAWHKAAMAWHRRHARPVQFAFESERAVDEPVLESLPEKSLNPA